MVRIISIFLLLLFVFPSGVRAGFRLGENGPRMNGFVELLFGPKLGHDTTKKDDYNVFENRLQLKTTIYPEFSELLKDYSTEINFKGDLLVDWYYDGKTNFYLRELNVLMTPLSWMDVKLGRQVLTWGTGDYVFLNDLFPKDYVSFYIGRDDEYLKVPNDAIKFAMYSGLANFDFVFIPVFEQNHIFKGDRLSFFDSLQGGIAGRDSDRHLIEPVRTAHNAEYATRIHRNIGSYEAALYTFRGFYKMPNSYLDELNRDLFYPRLDAYGSSIRGPVFKGIGNLEYVYYNSVQDKHGDNRLIQNSLCKYLFGYTQDMGNDTTLGLQYMLEQTLDYGEYREALLDSDFRWDEFRHLATVRITKLFLNQTLKLNIFAFFSPSDMDGYLRPSVDYDFSDQFMVTLGANLAWGEDDNTEFGQMENNKNIYLRLRYNF